MKNYLLLFAITTLLYNISFGQQCYTYTSSTQVLPLYHIVKSSDGGLIYSSSVNGFSTAAVLKAGSTGNVQWFNTVPWPFGVFNSIIETVDKQIVCSITNGNQEDIVFRMDAEGNILWAKRFDHSEYNVVWVVAATGDSGCIALTGRCSLGENVFIKIDKLGNRVWQQDYVTNLLGGAYYGTAVDDTSVVIGSSNFDTSGVNNINISLLKIRDTDGSVVWIKTYDTGQDDHPIQVIKTFDGGFTVCGGHERFQNTTRNTFVLHTNSSGDVLWSKVYQKNGEVISIPRVTELENGDYILAGERADTNALNMVVPDISALAIRTDATGNIIWQKSADNSNSNNGLSTFGVVSMGGNRFAMMGIGDVFIYVVWDMLNASGFCEEMQENVTAINVNSVQTTVPVSVRPVNDFVTNLNLNEIKHSAAKTVICDLTTEINNVLAVASAIKISPNPFSSFANVEVIREKPAAIQLAIYDIAGSKVWEKIFLPSDNLVIEKSDLSVGLYLLEVKQQGKRVGFSKFVID